MNQEALWKQASLELERIRSKAMKQQEQRDNPANDNNECYDEYAVRSRLPPACRQLVRSLPGNTHCVDCNAPNPQWASVTYGCLVCLKCSGRHRSYGVATSTVRSLDMDDLTLPQILKLLEGGNAQLQSFYDRHGMGNLFETRYHTKASLFYRSQLARHVGELARAPGPYPGREAVRQRKQKKHQEPSQTKLQQPQQEELERERSSSSCAQEAVTQETTAVPAATTAVASIAAQ